MQEQDHCHDRDLANATKLLGHMTCSIGCNLMVDPVIVIPTGQTYDRENIQAWLNAGHMKCPNTNQPLTMTMLIPNISLRAIIQDFVDEYKGKEGDQWKAIRDQCADYLAEVPVEKAEEPNRYMHPQSATKSASVLTPVADLEQRRREWAVFQAHVMEQKRMSLLANETPEQRAQRETRELVQEARMKENNAAWVRNHPAEYRADFERQQMEQQQNWADKERERYERLNGIH